MVNFGAIFIEKNICFKTTDNMGKYSLDHSYKTGRPVLIFCDDDEYMYYLTIHSYNGHIQNHDYKLENTNFDKESCINIGDIYRKKVCFVNVKDKIKYKDMLDILKKFIIYQTTIRKDEFFDEVFPLLQKQIDEILKEDPDLHFNIH